MGKKYSGNLTGGSLLINESVTVSGLLLKGYKEKEVRKKVLDDNLFQVFTETTSKKYLSLILPRLITLSSKMLKFITSGDELLCKMTIFYSLLKTNRLIYDFFKEVIIEKTVLNDCTLKKLDWNLFIENKALVEPEIANWTEKTQAKIRQVVMRILSEAEFLESVKNPHILFPLLPHELEEELIQKNELTYISLMKLER